MNYLLSWIIWLPIIGMAMIAFIPRDRSKLIKQIAAVVSGAQLLLAIYLWKTFDQTVGTFQFMDRAEWIPSFNITYILGVDGLSLPMVFLMALIGFIGVFVSWNIDKAVKGYFSLFLLLNTGVMGVFLALDFFLFYIFWEVMLLPMYFLIGIWGGPQREYAAIKFFLYTLAGSVLMLIAILALYFTCGNTFDMLVLMETAPMALNGMLWWGMSAIKVIWVLLFIGFAIKVPVFPFHTWLPDAHVEAPAPISVFLAGLLLKMGGYGFLRFNIGLLPEASAQYAWIFILVGIITMFYGAIVAIVQTDIKKMIALTSVNHMGFVMVGAFTGTVFGISGSIFQMFTHAAAVGIMFMLSGYLHEATGTRNITVIKGLKFSSPRLATLLILGSMAAMCIPIFSTFISEYLVILGAIQVNTIYALIVAVPAITVGYFLWMLRRVVMSDIKPGTKKWDLSNISTLALILYLVPLVLTLIAPWLILDVANPISTFYASLVSGGAA